MAQLRRLYTRVVDDDNAAVTSPLVTVMRVGAEIVRDASGGTTQVGVRHPGALVTNDVCVVERAGAILDGVTVTISDPTWTYDSGNGDWVSEISDFGSYTITVGDRLILTGNSPSHAVDVYDNDSAQGTAGSVTVGSNGLVTGYVAARDVDLRVVSGGSTTYITDIVTDNRDYVTPEDFGAVGDGTTDDTKALQIALDYVGQLSGGGELRLGEKTYAITSSLTVPGSVYVRGNGYDISVIETDQDIVALSIAGEDVTLEAFRIRQTDTNNTNSIGVDSEGTVSVSTSRLRIYKCRISGWNKCVRVDSSGTNGGWYHNIVDCQIEGRGKTASGCIGISLEGFANASRIQGGTITGCETGIKTVDNVDSCRVIGVDDIAACTTGIHFTTSYNSVIGCRFESNGTAGDRKHVRIGANYNSVVGSHFAGARSDVLVSVDGGVTNYVVIPHDPAQLDTFVNGLYQYDGSTGNAVWLRNTDFNARNLTNIAALTTTTLNATNIAAATMTGTLNTDGNDINLNNGVLRGNKLLTNSVTASATTDVFSTASVVRVAGTTNISKITLGGANPTGGEILYLIADNAAPPALVHTATPAVGQIYCYTGANITLTRFKVFTLIARDFGGTVYWVVSG